MELSYEEWLKKNEINNPNHPMHFYDYKAAYKAGVMRNPETGHMDSKFKHELHPNRYVIQEDGSILDTKYMKPATEEDMIMQKYKHDEYVGEFVNMMRSNASRII